MNKPEAKPTEYKDGWGHALMFWGGNLLGAGLILYGIQLMATGAVAIGLVLVVGVAYFMNEHLNV